MKVLIRIFILLLFLGLLTGIIAFARGYRLDLKKQTVTSTGIVAISAFPKAAKIYVNGELKGVTDTNLTLPPGVYNIEVKKDGYTSWKKNLKLKGELVLTLDVLLYPLNSSLSPLTNISVVKAVPLAQSNKIILFSENDDPEKDGIYLYESSAAPISFFTPIKPIALKKTLKLTLGEFSLNETEVEVSPDTKEAVVTFTTTFNQKVSYLLNLGEENISFFDISESRQTLVDAWNSQIEEVNNKILEAYPADINKIASDSFRVIEFSPDETKLLYQAKKSLALPQVINPPLIAVNQTAEDRNLVENSLYVYDKKEDRNYRIDLTINNQQSFNFGQDKSTINNFVTWFSDSKHLVINEGKKISFIDFDNQNKQTVFSGIFDGNFFKVTSDGKILILTNLNPDANRFPDLYAVGIR